MELTFHASQAIYFNGSVVYDGRATSELGPANLLLLYKSDNSVAIHGNSLIMPRNYISGIISTTITDNSVVFCSKKESLTVAIEHVFAAMPLDELSLDAVKLRKTEAELVTKIETNWDDFIGIPAARVHREYQTLAGPIDLVGICDDTFHVVEVKRKKASLAHCSQLYRYLETFHPGAAYGYLASPSISANALRHLEAHNCRWVQVDFD